MSAIEEAQKILRETPQYLDHVTISRSILEALVRLARKDDRLCKKRKKRKRKKR